MKKERERPTGTGNKSVSVANHARRLGLFTCNRYGPPRPRGVRGERP